MKKVIFLIVVFMMNNCISAMEREITTVTKSAYDKLPQDGVVNRATGENRIPLRIGNKQFTPQDIEKLTPKQKDLLVKISNPSCCLLPYGVDSNTLRECDIAEIKKEMPAHITEKLGVYVVKEKKCVANCCLGTAGGFSLVSYAGAEIASCIAMPTGNVAACKATIWLGFGSVVGLLALGVIKLVHPCICRDKEWYEFEVSDDSNTEQNDWLDLQEQEDSLSD